MLTLNVFVLTLSYQRQEGSLNPLLIFSVLLNKKGLAEPIPWSVMAWRNEVVHAGQW